jgi:hypothetical protein
VVTFAGAAGAAEVAGAGADVAGAALAVAAAPDAVSVDGELGAGLAGAAVVVAGAPAAPPAALAPHPDAEHDDCPPGAADAAAGVTSFACTGAGVAPPHATAALVPRTARTAAILSRLRSGRIGFLLDSV